MIGAPPHLVGLLAAVTMFATCWLAFSLLVALLYRVIRGPILALPSLFRYWLLLGFGMTPLLASLAATCSVMIPEGLLLHIHCHATVGCGAHTPIIGSAAVAYLSLLAGAPLLLFALRGWATIRANRRATASLRELDIGRDSRGFRLIGSDRPLALCAGWWRGEVRLSVALLAALDVDELEVVLSHERTHGRRRDNLVRVVFALLFCPLAVQPAASLLRDLALAMEQIADREAAQHSGAEQVAHTLLHAQRLGLRTLHAGFSSFTPSAIEARIDALLSEHRAPTTLHAIAIPLALLLVALAAFAIGVDGGHHAIEALFGASR